MHARGRTPARPRWRTSDKGNLLGAGVVVPAMCDRATQLAHHRSPRALIRGRAEQKRDRAVGVNASCASTRLRGTVRPSSGELALRDVDSAGGGVGRLDRPGVALDVASPRPGPLPRLRRRNKFDPTSRGRRSRLSGKELPMLRRLGSDRKPSLVERKPGRVSDWLGLAASVGLAPPAGPYRGHPL